MLLTIDAPGIEALRPQVPHLRVARWDCGCASFDLQVDPNHALAGVEIVDYVERHGDESPDEIPPPGAWNEPFLRGPASSTPS